MGERLANLSSARFHPLSWAAFAGSAWIPGKAATIGELPHISRLFPGCAGGSNARDIHRHVAQTFRPTKTPAANVMPTSESKIQPRAWLLFTTTSEMPTRWISRKAAALATAWVDIVCEGQARIVREATIAKPCGWIFFVPSIDFLENGTASAPLAFVDVRQWD